ncbi:hypothetical protein LZ009_09655 [Ramlibacter sp. XY19]|nr:hypothetical protein [Ramlibacter paludis]MCG2593045.1 hypothetical protein [Ramlibacter paludis]
MLGLEHVGNDVSRHEKEDHHAAAAKVDELQQSVAGERQEPGPGDQTFEVRVELVPDQNAGEGDDPQVIQEQNSPVLRRLGMTRVYGFE